MDSQKVQALEGLVCDLADVAAAYAWGNGILKGNVYAELEARGVAMDLIDEAEVDRLVALYGEQA